jgi:hypothetical protein
MDNRLGEAAEVRQLSNQPWLHSTFQRDWLLESLEDGLVNSARRTRYQLDQALWSDQAF